MLEHRFAAAEKHTPLPGKAGVRVFPFENWTPTFAGMTGGRLD
jgi:hypothetical protein